MKGHRTENVGDFAAQFALTMDNVEKISRAMGFEGALDPESAFKRDFKIFVRSGSDAESARSAFADVVGYQHAAQTPVIRADICRSDLLVEVEAIYRAG